MATVNKAGTPSLSSVLPPQNSTIVGLYAGEAIEAGDVCTIASNGTIVRSDGSAADGIALVGAPEGEAITIARNVNVRYGSGLTPGARLYAGSGGALDDASGVPCGFVVDSTRIHFYGSHGGNGGGGGTDNVTENVGSEV